MRRSKKRFFSVLVMGDLAFILLIFFVVLIQQKQSQINKQDWVKIVQAEDAPDGLVISFSEEGEILYKEQSISKEQLVKHLKDEVLMLEQDKRHIVLSVNKQILMKNFLPIYELLHEVNVPIWHCVEEANLNSKKP